MFGECDATIDHRYVWLNGIRVSIKGEQNDGTNFPVS